MQTAVDGAAESLNNWSALEVNPTRRVDSPWSKVNNESPALKEAARRPCPNVQDRIRYPESRLLRDHAVTARLNWAERECSVSIRLHTRQELVVALCE